MTRHPFTKYTIITRCVMLCDFFAYDFFGVTLEVAPGSLEFLIKSENGELYIEQLFSTYTVFCFVYYI